jgi:hypothetical protein
LLFLSSALALAQQSATHPASDDNSSTKHSQDAQMKAEQSQRFIGVVPMFAVTDRQDARALTAGEKFHLWEKTAFDPFTGAALLLQAGMSQWQNEFPEYGQGAAGYGKRLGASLADNVSSGFFSDAVFASLLKEDPRYFRVGQGPFRRRLIHALSSEFICHTDNGSRSPNLANFFGAFTTGGISNLYYPPADRGFELTMSRSAISLAYGSAGGIFSEFGPDLQAKFLHRRHKPIQ